MKGKLKERVCQKKRLTKRTCISQKKCYVKERFRKENPQILWITNWSNICIYEKL